VKIFGIRATAIRHFGYWIIIWKERRIAYEKKCIFFDCLNMWALALNSMLFLRTFFLQIDRRECFEESIGVRITTANIKKGREGVMVRSRGPEKRSDSKWVFLEPSVSNNVVLMPTPLFSLYIFSWNVSLKLISLPFLTKEYKFWMKCATNLFLW
jgi:hypothetical protein